MKEKLKSLESEGINPTRDHVMNHLDAIKDLTFGKLYGSSILMKLFIVPIKQMTLYNTNDQL